VGNITNVALQTDINKVHEIAIEVKRIWKMIKENQDFGLLLNERQRLFGMDVVPFERLNMMIKEFEPYETLWVTASGNNNANERESKICTLRRTHEIYRISKRIFLRKKTLLLLA